MDERLDFFFNWDLLLARITATTRHGVTRKRSTKRLQHIGNLFRQNLQLKDPVNSRLKATKIIGQRKAF